ncbi:MAG: hypothetical protein JXR76_22085 [Deltaproteobacteria bacterium]|nr:hypothetical protein [Deltaproteobacteria bacterium]
MIFGRTFFMSVEVDAFEALVGRIRSLYETELGALGVTERQRRLVRVNWLVGRYIVESEQEGEIRARYGSKLIEKLSLKLTEDLGLGFSKRKLEYSRAFYSEYEIAQTSAQLSWSHYVALLSVPDKDVRDGLMQRAVDENLTHEALLQLVKAHNQQVAQEAGRRKLVPRKGRLNVCRVIAVERETGSRAALDLGFYVTQPLSRARANNFSVGQHVEWLDEDGGFRLRGIACRIGERYCYEGYLQKVVDGDTLLVEVLLANGTTLLSRLRLRANWGRRWGNAAKDSLNEQ